MHSRFQRNATWVAAQFGVSWGTVAALAKAARIKLANPRPWSRGKEKSIPARTRNRIIKAFKANPNAATRIAAQFEVSEPMARKIAKEANVAPPPKATLSKKKRTRILDALEVNPSAAQVARQIGDVSTTTVWKIAKHEALNLPASSFPQRSAPRSSKRLGPTRTRCRPPDRLAA